MMSAKFEVIDKFKDCVDKNQVRALGQTSQIEIQNSHSSPTYGIIIKRTVSACRTSDFFTGPDFSPPLPPSRENVL